MSRVQAIERVFKSAISSRQIHEAVLLGENTKGDFSACHGYGGRNMDSPLIMASVTKLFTTACILALWEQGRLSLDDRMEKYFDKAILKGLHIYKGKEYTFELTISDLLFQTSGLPDYFEEGSSMKMRTVKEDYSITFEEMLELTKNLRPHFAPLSSKKAYYADINFDFLGEIIEKITQFSLEKAYEDFIFNPLGLTKTYLLTNENDFVPNIYYKNKLMYRPRAIMSYRASGGCITTARELMVFIKAFFGGILFSKNIFEKLSIYRKLQFSMGPIHYGGGFMEIPMCSISTLFMGKGELLGHSGVTGSFAFYYPHKDLYFTGVLNQMVDPSLPLRLVMRLATTVK